MSGLIGSKLNIRGSGLVEKQGTDGQVLTSAGAGVQAAFEDIAAALSWQAVTTGSTLTAVAGNGYWINTTSNTCTITLPASASNGDTIMFADYARTWGTNKIIIDSNGLNYQTNTDATAIEYDTNGQIIHIVYSDATQGWIPVLDKTVEDKSPAATSNANGIFAYGTTGSVTNLSNLVSNVGVIADDVTGVGTSRSHVAACEFGEDKALFGYGTIASAAMSSLTNLVSSSGVIASDVSGVGTARQNLAACTYGGDKGIFAFGSGFSNLSNKVSSSGVVASDTSGVGTARSGAAALEYSSDKDKGIFRGGYSGSATAVSNLVSNAGVVATDTTGVGTASWNIAGANYGFDKGIFGFGESYVSHTNLVSNVGVVASDTSGVGTARGHLAAPEFGNDKAIFGYGNSGSVTNLSNLVSNAGVVASDVTGVGTSRAFLGGCSYN